MIPLSEDNDNFYVLRDSFPCISCGESTNLLSKMHMQILCKDCYGEADAAIHRFIVREMERYWQKQKEGLKGE